MLRIKIDSGAWNPAITGRSATSVMAFSCSRSIQRRRERKLYGKKFGSSMNLLAGRVKKSDIEALETPEESQ